MTWDDAMDETLKQGWTDGWPAPMIAEKINRTHSLQITKNSVIGRAHRVGLPRRCEPHTGTPSHRALVPPPARWYRHVEAMNEARRTNLLAPQKLPQRKRKFLKPGRLTHDVTPRVRIAPDFPAEPVVIHEDIYVAPADRKGILELTESSCKWPIGDPREADFHFCGGPRVPGLPYCEGHCKRAYQTVQEVDARRLRAMKAA